VGVDVERLNLSQIMTADNMKVNKINFTIVSKQQNKRIREFEETEEKKECEM
jgi:hypothetical protein